jgi:hypothetical protein
MQLAAVKPINDQIKALQKKIDDQIQALQRKIAHKVKVPIKLTDDDLNTTLSVKALQDISARLAKIHKILNVSRYNLVFIGQVGAGKTTSICHLFNLVQEIEDTQPKGNTKIKKVKELLSTGSGRSTICEVVLQSGEETWIEIEPYEDKELQQLIEDFGLWIWHKARPESIKKQVEIPPAELLRAIRNIVALPETVINGKIHDQALEFACGFTINQYADFQRSLLDRGKLANRNETKLRPPTNSYMSTEKARHEKLWISKTFQALNVANLPNFSIPKKIHIHLAPYLLDFAQYSRFGNIIDTRGLDLATKDRRDLASYIRENDNAICIFTEKFPSAPANIIQIVGKYLTATASDIDTKFALLVMPRKGEPEKVIGADGQAVEDMEEGTALRRATIENAFQNEGIDFVAKNILFYDALHCYLGDGRIDRNIEGYDPNTSREHIFASIEQIIANREQKLIGELAVLEDQFQQIVRSNWSKNESTLVENAAQKVGNLHNIPTLTSTFSEKFINMLPEHHSTLHATNKRYGHYASKGIDIYFNGRYLAEALVRQSTKGAKEEILQILKSVESSATPDSKLHPLLQRLRHQIDENYEGIAIALSNTIETVLSEKVLSPQDYNNSVFWRNVIDRWGEGNGYKADVLKRYRQQVGSIDKTLNDLIQTEWGNRVVQPILDFLGEAAPFLQKPDPLSITGTTATGMISPVAESFDKSRISARILSQSILN